MPTALALIIISFLAATARSSEPFTPDVTGRINTEWIENIDHLEPFRGDVPEYYYLAQFIEVRALVDEGTYLVVLRCSEPRAKLAVADLVSR